MGLIIDPTTDIVPSGVDCGGLRVFEHPDFPDNPDNSDVMSC
jgi:hypothetical protein